MSIGDILIFISIFFIILSVVLSAEYPPKITIPVGILGIIFFVLGITEVHMRSMIKEEEPKPVTKAEEPVTKAEEPVKKKVPNNPISDQDIDTVWSKDPGTVVGSVDAGTVVGSVDAGTVVESPEEFENIDTTSLYGQPQSENYPSEDDPSSSEDDPSPSEYDFSKIDESALFGN